MMTSLMYYSKVSPGISADEIGNIFKAARHRNMETGITGILYSDGKWFLQVLEGVRHEVSNTYNKITKDLRHKNCVIVSVRQIEVRQFPDWSMGLIKSDPATVDIMKGVVGTDEFVPAYFTFEQMNDLLVRFADSRLRGVIPHFKVSQAPEQQTF